MQEYYLLSVVLIYLLVVFVNSPEVRVPEKVMFKAPDNLSPYDFFSHCKCSIKKCTPNTGQVIEAFTSWVRKQKMWHVA